jgi:2-haloacid dehalogenase
VARRALLTVAIDTVVFDVGGVLLDWDPAHLYRQVLTDEEMARFFAEVCTWDWHHQHDRGVPFSETIPALCERFPDDAAHIALWQTRYADMVAGEVVGMRAVVDELRTAGLRLLILSNMPSEVWPGLTERHHILAGFDGAVISGDEGLVKPDPAIYRVLLDRYDVDPVRAAFVDDREENVVAAADLGFTAIRFTDAASLQIPR